MNLDFDDLFSEKNMTILDPKEKMQMLKASLETQQDEEKKLKVMAHFLDEVANEEFNLIEKYPLHYYEDGIENLENALMFSICSHGTLSRKHIV